VEKALISDHKLWPITSLRKARLQEEDVEALKSCAVSLSMLNANRNIFELFP